MAQGNVISKGNHDTISKTIECKNVKIPPGYYITKEKRTKE